MSSEEEAVGRNSTADGLQSPLPSEPPNDSDTFVAGRDQMDEDDADLFGSDDEENGVGNLEYAALL